MSTWIVRFAPVPPGGPTRVAVKDLIDMVGVATTSGSKAIAAGAEPAAADAACLAGIRAEEAAGRAVIVGRTNLHELAFGVSGVNPWYGTPVNPIDPALVPGGSSSGSAVAVATGEADVAIGTDTGGSVRIPAACCGVVGLKTTRGRIPLAGVARLAPSLDTVGPMGATVAATALGMQLLEPGFTWEASGVARRVGRFRSPATAAVDEAVDGALSRYAAATGATVTEVDLPGWDAATEAVGLILMAEAWSVHGGLWAAQSGELSPDVAARLEAGSLLEPVEVAAAWEAARAWSAQVAAAFGACDVIAMPVLSAPPPRLEEAAEVARIRYTGPWNLAGVPAVALPVGGPGGGPGGGSGGAAGAPWPVSLQLVGPARSEARLLATAAAVETEAGYPGGYGDPAR